MPVFNISNYNLAPRLSAQNCKVCKFPFSGNFHKRLNTKKPLPNIKVWGKASVPFLNFDMSSLNYKFKMFSTVTQALNEWDIDIKLKIDANYK